MPTPAPPTQQDNKRGLFISCEGGDGCGKTTQARLLGEWLGPALHKEVLLTREPGGTPLGQQIRQLVLHGDDMGPHAEALLYAADRAHHVHSLVKPALERDTIVITDRYFDSSIAYQSGGRELTATEVRNLSMWATENLVPDLTILFDIDPKVGASRFTDAPDRLERAGADFHQRTRETYLHNAAQEPDRWIVIDGHGTIEEVAQLTQQAVRVRLQEKFAHYAHALTTNTFTTPESTV
ncbi:dTMP kinase [Timonella sp. A28]|uniref:dTMP kinase n=1 Tax=Timonella sp. A28 TaxID=3442640 RepID=UPI003EBE6801